MQCKCGGPTVDREHYRECRWCGRVCDLPPRAAPVSYSAPKVKPQPLVRGGIRKWRTLDDRSRFDYSALSDAMLWRMKAEATAQVTTFSIGNLAFADQLVRLGIDGINRELWARGLTEAQRNA